LPDIAKINNVAVADISKLDSITFADGQKVNNQSVSLITEAHTLISTHTASSSSSLDITSGIDSTYDIYEFRYENMHPQTGGSHWSFQVNADGQLDFNETMTTTYFFARHNESDSTASLAYGTGDDQAEGNAYQGLAHYVGADNDQAASGILQLYAPASTTYVKHFTVESLNAQHSDYSFREMVAGYINTTSAIDEISFKFSSGNIDAGVIKMYGVAKS